MPPQPIAFCITELDAGGAERALVQLVTRLDRHEWMPHVFCLQGRGVLVNSLEQAGISVTCLEGCCPYDIRTILRLKKELHQQQPRIVQTFLFQANVIGTIAARWAGCPHVMTGIRVAERRRNPVYQLEKWLSNWADLHVCVSRQVAEQVQQKWSCPSEKISVIPNGIDIARFQEAVPLSRAELDLSPDQQVLLYVGRLDEQKGVLQFVPLVKQLRQRSPQIILLIAGEGPQRLSLEQEIKKHQLQNSMRLLGQRDDIPRLLKTAELFVFSSRWEGMPNAVMEAIAAQLPVVTTAVEGIEDLLKDGISGKVVPIDDEQALLEAVSELLENRTSGQLYADAALAHLQQHYSWEKTVNRYESLYRQILAAD